MHPYNLIHQNFATVNTLPLIDSWLVLVSCSIDELGQTRLEEAIKSEKQRLVNYSIRDKLWMGFQSASRWHSKGGRQTCLKQATRYGRTTSVHVGPEANPTDVGPESKIDGGRVQQKMKEQSGRRDLGWKQFTARGGASVCTALFKDLA